MSEDAPMTTQTLDSQESQAAETWDVKVSASPEAPETPKFEKQEPDEVDQSQEIPDLEQASKKLKLDPAAMALVLEADAGMFAPTEIGSLSDGMHPPPPPKGKGKGKKGKAGKSGKNTSGADAPSQAVVAASPSDPGDDHSVASGQSKTKAQGKGQKKASKTNSRYCKGDGLYYSQEDMAPKSAFCFRCKYSMDVLTKLAKAKGRPEWIAEIKSNEKILQNVIRKYKEQTGDGIVRKRNFKGSLMSTLQETAAKSRVLYDTEMEMMTEDAYQLFAMTEAGGRLSKAAATAQWAEWRCQVESGDIPEDLIFDFKRGLRIAVGTKDTVHFQSESWLHEVLVGAVVHEHSSSCQPPF